MKKMGLLLFVLIAGALLLSICFAFPVLGAGAETPSFEIEIYDPAGNKVSPFVSSNDLGQDILEVPYGTGYTFRVASSDPDVLVDASSLTVTRNDPLPSVMLQKNEYVSSVYYKDNEVCHYQFIIKFSYTKDGKKSSAILPLNFKITPLEVDVAFSSLELEYGSGKTIVGILDKPAYVQTSDILAFRFYNSVEDYNQGNSIEFPTAVGDYYVESYIENSNPNINISDDFKLTPFKIVKSKAYISATNKTCEFTGNTFDLPTLMNAASSVGGLDFSAYMGDERIPVKDVLGVGEYYIYFIFHNPEFFESPEYGPYKLTVEKANTQIIASSVTYQLNFENPQSFNPAYVVYNGEGVACNQNAFEISTSFYSIDGQMILFNDIDTAGKYLYSVKTADSENYFACESDKTEFNFSIKKIMVENGITINSDDEVIKFVFSGDKYHIGDTDDADIVYSISDIFDDSATIKCDINGGNAFDLVEPGEYKVTLSVEDESHIAQKSFTVNVDKVDISAQTLKWIEDGGFALRDGIYYMIYDGTNTLPQFSVDVPEDCAIKELLDSLTYTTFTTSDYLKYNKEIEIWEKKNFAGVGVGQYKVSYSLDHKWLRGTWVVQYEYTRRDLTLAPKDLVVSYGDYPFGVANRDFRESVYVDGLAETDEEVFYSSLSLQIKDSVGNVYEGFGLDLPCGNYTLALSYGNIGISENYNVTIVNGSLTFNKAVLNVEFKKLIHPYTMPLTLDNIVFSYKAPYYDLNVLEKEVSDNLEIVFLGDDGNFYDFESLPSEPRTYQISCRGEFSTYTLNVTNADLLLYSPAIRADGGEATLRGKFSPLCDASIIIGSSDKEMENALSKYGSLSVVKVVKIYSELILLDNETIESCSMDINISDVENPDEITVYAKKNGEYHRVSCLVSNNKVTVILAEGFEGFVICIPTPYDFTWIIILACGAVLLIGIVSLVIVLYKKGAFIKGKAKMGESVAPTADHVTEEEAFDAMIAGFDASTVTKGKSFAEELEAKKEQELYAQYRLRLEKARRAGDKHIEDMLKEKGIKRIDDDVIIKQMIENDRKRAREIEEQEAREKAEAEAKAEAERRVVVKKSGGDGSYSQQTFAPKKKKNDGDIDF